MIEKTENCENKKYFQEILHPIVPLLSLTFQIKLFLKFRWEVGNLI